MINLSKQKTLLIYTSVNNYIRARKSRAETESIWIPYKWRSNSSIIRYIKRECGKYSTCSRCKFKDTARFCYIAKLVAKH